MVYVTTPVGGVPYPVEPSHQHMIPVPEYVFEELLLGARRGHYMDETWEGWQIVLALHDQFCHRPVDEAIKQAHIDEEDLPYEERVEMARARLFADGYRAAKAAHADEQDSAYRDADRCTSCEHSLSRFHREGGGCWFTTSVGTPGKDAVCPCSIPGTDATPDPETVLRDHFIRKGGMTEGQAAVHAAEGVSALRDARLLKGAGE